MLAAFVASVGLFSGIRGLVLWSQFWWSGKNAEDSVAWWTAGRILQSGRGHALYDLKEQFLVQNGGPLGVGETMHLKAFMNAPHLAWTMYPFGSLSPANVYRIVTATQFVVLVGIIWYGLRRIAASWTGVEKTVAAAITLSAVPAILSVQLGSFSILISALGICSLVSARSNHFVRSGVCLALMSTKPQLALVLGLLLLFSGHWRAVRNAFFATIAFAAISLPFIGLDGYRGWVNVLRNAVSTPELIGNAPQDMWNFRMLLMRIGLKHPDTVSTVAFALVVIACALLAWRGRAQRLGGRWVFTFAAATSMAITSLYFNPYDNVLIVFLGWFAYEELRANNASTVDISQHNKPSTLRLARFLLPFGAMAAIATDMGTPTAAIVPAIVLTGFATLGWKAVGQSVRTPKRPRFLNL
jgi:Glycosyltransferase family 87